jgi:hypothetical protein
MCALGGINMKMVHFENFEIFLGLGCLVAIPQADWPEIYLVEDLKKVIKSRKFPTGNFSGP